MPRIVSCALLLFWALAMPTAAVADELEGEADVVDVAVERTGANTFRFDVTIASNETGWDYYADAFEVVGPDEEVLGVRTLHHPHVDEQPFTRALTGVEIPPEIEQVTVRAHHNEAGYDGRTQTVDVPH